jgi:hypothetical protein
VIKKKKKSTRTIVSTAVFCFNAWQTRPIKQHNPFSRLAREINARYIGYVWQVTYHTKIVSCYFLELVKSGRYDIK